MSEYKNTFWACKDHTHNNTLRCAICDEQHITELEAQLAEFQNLVDETKEGELAFTPEDLQAILEKYQ